MQDSCQQLKSDSTSWQRTLKSSHNLQSQWHVVSILYQEMKNHLTRKVGFEGTPKFDPSWKSQPATCKVIMEWKLELNLWTKTILTRGSEFLMDWTSWSQIWSTTSRKPQRCSSKTMRWKRMYLLLHADQRLKQNREDLPLLAHLQELYLFLKEHGLILNQELNSIKRTQWQKDETLFFGTENYLEKKMERLNSGDWKMILNSLPPSSSRSFRTRPIDSTLQDNVSIPNNLFENICHIGCAINLHSIINSGLIPGGQNLSKERQTVFFTTVNPMNKENKDPYEIDLKAPRLAWYKQRKRHQDTAHRADTQPAQEKGPKPHQTRSNAIILYDTLPAYCIPKVIMMESGEIIYEKVYVSPRPPPTISFRDNWMKELDSEAAGRSKDTQRIQQKPKTQLSRTVRPVGGQQSTQLEEIDIDFRVPGSSHAVVKEAENFRVQELVKKIESHPHREALQADLQQNNVYNPFSNNSKAMIREMGNVEVFELCETIPKVQCSQCLLCWNQGVIFCTCGQFLVEGESRRKFNKLRLDALSIPHYEIKKGRPHGVRHGKNEEQKEYHIAFNAWKRCRKRVDAQDEHYKGIHDRFPQRPSLSWITTPIWLGRAEVHRNG